MALCGIGVKWITTRGNLSEETERIGLQSRLPGALGVEDATGRQQGFVEPPGREVTLAQKQKAHRIARDLTRRFQLVHSFLEKQQSLRDASGTDVAEPQPRGADWDECLEVTPCGTERTFQQRDGVEEVVLVETGRTRGQARECDAVPVRLLDVLDLL